MALETTTNAQAVADLIRPHVARVVVSNPVKTRIIAEARIKTDKVDAEVLAQLLRCEYLPEVWAPDVHTRLLRRLSSRRAGLKGVGLDRQVVRRGLRHLETAGLVAVERKPGRHAFSRAKHNGQCIGN